MPIAQRCSLLLYAGHPGLCHRCGRPLTGRQAKWCGANCENAYWRNHYWALARDAALKRDGHRCVKCGSADGLEVNHIEPLVGRGYQSGCVHHLSNLETLCHTCHLAATANQRQMRKTAGGSHK